MTPRAVIRFTATSGPGTSLGVLSYRGRRLLELEQGQSLGYGSLWWRAGQVQERVGALLVFRGHQVVRGTLDLAGAAARTAPQRLLLVGLGSALWYGEKGEWRDDRLLLTAAEGFWRASPGCPTLP